MTMVVTMMTIVIDYIDDAPAADSAACWLLSPSRFCDLGELGGRACSAHVVHHARVCAHARAACSVRTLMACSVQVNKIFIVLRMIVRGKLTLCRRKE